MKKNVRSWLIPIITEYLTDRQCSVKYNDQPSYVHSLPGAGSQGTILGMLNYLINSNDNADCVEEDMRYKFVDDLTVLELVLLGSLVTEYNFHQHIASDIGIDELYLPTQNFNTQSYVNFIQDWTELNLMKLNVDKCNYMIFSRSKTEFSTRLALNYITIDSVEEQKILGIWLSTYMDWERNCQELCSKAYSRIHMLTKLKYVGTKKEDLINIYILFIRSLLEYCSVVWHSSLTVDQTNDVENVQRVCLRVILGDDYDDYPGSLVKTGLDLLKNRRQQKCLTFGLKCIQHPKHRKMFPMNENNLRYQTRHRELFKVNTARTSYYQSSSIIYIQTKLNEYFLDEENKENKFWFLKKYYPDLVY